MEHKNIELFLKVVGEGIKHFKNNEEKIKQKINQNQLVLIEKINNKKEKSIEYLKEMLQEYNVMCSRDLSKYSEKYVKLITETIEKTSNNFNNIEANSNQIKRYSISVQGHASNFVSYYTNIINGIEQYYKQWFIDKNVISNLKFLAESDRNVVVIGANGSGKSTFARSLIGKTYSNLNVIPAQKVFNYNRIKSYTNSTDIDNNLRALQKSPRLQANSNYIRELSDEFDIIFKKLIADRADKADNYYEGDKKEECVLNRVISIWDEIMNGSKLKYIKSTLALRIQPANKDIKDYDFKVASDGEKAIFYYIASILLAQNESYIVIDEPENHLNLSIINTLWDTLETYRNDLNFIYLTHNVDFASSRLNCNVYWMKSYNYIDNTWDIEELTSTTYFPKQMLLELVGSRRKILFCEGDDKGSYDYKLYSILFTDYTVIPTGSHRKAIEYCKTFNETPMFNERNEAIAIIDLDDYEEKTILDWRENKIYTLPYKEIENLLLIEPLIQKAGSQFLIEDSLKVAEEALFKSFKRNIDTSIIRSVEGKLNNKIRKLFVEKHRDLDKLADTFNKGKDDIDIQSIIVEVTDEHKSCLDNLNYDDILRIYNNKDGILHEVGNKFTLDYGNKIIKLLSEDASLATLMKNVILYNKKAEE